MTVPDPYASAQPQRADAPASSLLRAAIWVAIGALIAAAIVCVVWVLIGEQNGIVGRAFLTIVLLVAFAGVTILDAHLAPGRPAWFAVASLGTWVVALLIGAVMIWMPERDSWGGFSRFVQFLFIVLILQLVLLHVRLYLKSLHRFDTAFTRTVAIVTITLVVALAGLLIIPLMLGEYLTFPDIYWRVVVAVAILAAVGTALIPLVNVLFAPKRPRAVAPYPASYAVAPVPVAPQQLAAQPEAAPHQELLPWPNYVDNATPLPMLPDGSPDWNAYYTGYPTPGAHVFGAPAPAPTAQPEVAPTAPSEPASTVSSEAAPPAPPTPPATAPEDYPPPPPLPPRP